MSMVTDNQTETGRQLPQVDTHHPLVIRQLRAAETNHQELEREGVTKAVLLLKAEGVTRKR